MTGDTSVRNQNIRNYYRRLQLFQIDTRWISVVKFTPSTLHVCVKSPGTHRVEARWPGGAVWTFRRRDFSVFKKSIDRFWGPSRRLFNRNGWQFRSGHGEQDVKLTTRLYLVPRLGMNGAIPTFTQMLSYRAQVEFCVYLQTVTEVKLWKINGWKWDTKCNYITQLHFT